MELKYVEKILFGIADKLQLSPTLYEQAVSRYETISEIIKKDDSFEGVEIKIYPQGSFRLKTTVKPISNEEYDLDFVAELSSSSEMNPKELYDNIYRILKNDGIHNNMIEPKKRCVRVNYANDFHLDIMPAKQINGLTHEIIVPDKDLKNWYHHSNPIGFAEWFENQAKEFFIKEIRQQYAAQVEVEEISEQEMTRRLEPLRRAVQLVKRYRDIYCSENDIKPVRSIVLCTLMGRVNNYSGDTLQIIRNFCFYVNQLITANGDKPFEVKNPVVDEVLTEKWSEGKNYKDFVDMMSALTHDAKALCSLSINSEINTVVKKMFGEDITNVVITDYARKINENRKDNNLSINKQGVLSTDKSGIPVKKNTFYGGD